MATIFKYKNKFYQAANFNKKLKRLKVSREEVEIFFEGELTQSELEKKFLEFTQKEKEIEQESWHNPNLFYFFNPKDGSSIISIKRDISDLPLKVEEYEPTTKEYLEEYWNKARSI